MEKTVLARIGKRIKQLRMEQGMNQVEFAKKCELEKAALSRIESGGSNLTIRSLIRISDALGTTISDLLK